MTPNAAATAQTREIRAEIAESRRALGDTVAALAEKTDVRRQGRRRVEELREAAAPAAVIAGVAAFGFALWLLLRRR